MIAYYVHWIYPPSADDNLYYGGFDDERLFHREENAIAYATNFLKTLNENVLKANALDTVLEEEGRQPTDEEAELLSLLYYDIPSNYIIYKRDIKFEDEE